MAQTGAIAGLCAASFALNMPLGVWRSTTEPLSPAWFVAVHAAVPVIIATRRRLGLGRQAIPFGIAAAIAGLLDPGLAPLILPQVSSQVPQRSPQ